MPHATHADYEITRAAALVRRDNRPRWVDRDGRIHTHRPDVECVRVRPTAPGCVAFAHQPARS